MPCVGRGCGGTQGASAVVQQWLGALLSAVQTLSRKPEPVAAATLKGRFQLAENAPAWRSSGLAGKGLRSPGGEQAEAEAEGHLAAA